MTLWLDAQLPPALAGWIRATLGIDCRSIRDLGLRDAKDVRIFHEARAAGAVVMTKDLDFVELRDRLGSPPKIIWLTCGHILNARLRVTLAKHLARRGSTARTGRRPGRDWR